MGETVRCRESYALVSLFSALQFKVMNGGTTE